MFNLLSANILIKTGNGGNGSKASTVHHRSVIFHGGNGGKGGDVIFVYSDNLLINNEFKHNNIKAEDGFSGKPGKKDGKDGRPLIVKLTQNCNIYDECNNLLSNININNTRYIVSGGSGGLGSRSTKSIQFKNINLGRKTESIKLTISTILPPGSVLIINEIDKHIIQEYLLRLYKYKSSIEDDIICIYKDNQYIYIVPYCNLYTARTLKHISKIDSISLALNEVYKDNIYYQAILLHYNNIIKDTYVFAW